MRDFTKYEVWSDAIELARMIYLLTEKFPAEEKFGLISQIRRSAISISSNIAEGCSRSSEKDFKRFVEISLGSAFELRSQLVISNKLGYLNALLNKISKQLNSLITKLRA